MPTQCPVFRAFTRQGHIAWVYCGLWSCPVCAKRLARHWGNRAWAQVSKADVPYYFITLTLGSKYSRARQGFEELPRLWDNIRVWITRRLGRRKWHYMAFVEGQPKRSYMPHFHIIIDVSIDKLAHEEPEHLRKHLVTDRKYARLQDWAVAMGFGHQAKEKPVKDQQAADYVAKYASKQSPETPKGFRRVRCSQDWAKVKEPTKHELLVKARTEFLSEYLWRVSEVTGVPLDELYKRWELSEQLSDE